MRAALLLIAVLLVLVVPVGAQADYFFAWDSASGQVIAYDLTGNIVPLIIADEVFPPIWQLADDSALAVMSVAGQPGIYHLTPQGAQPLTPSEELPYTRFRKLAGQSGQYVVLVAENGAFGTGVLVDLGQNTATRLTGESFILLDTWRFAADGAHLRYLSREAANPLLWAIRERRLDTGNERIIYQFETPYPAIKTDRSGENWLYSSLDPNTNVLTHVQVDLLGHAEQLAEQALTTPPLTFTSYQLFGEDTVSYTAPCTANCTITIGDQNFAIDALLSPNVTPFTRLADGDVIALLENQFWRLDVEGAATLLGTFDGLKIFTDPPHLISPDGRWIVVANAEAQQFALIDLETQTPVLADGLGLGLQVSYQPGGVLIQQEQPRQTFIYRYSDQTALEIPGEEGGFYFALLDDGTLLHTQTAPEGERPAGIYRYDPVAQTFSNLVEGYFPLIAR